MAACTTASSNDLMATPVDALSEYERKRLQRMQQNKQQLVSLGLDKSLMQKPTKKRERDAAVKPTTVRRSSRLQQAAAAVHQSAQDDAEDHQVQRQRPSKRVSARPLPYTPSDLPEVAATGARSGGRASSSILDIDLDHFHDKWLGNQILPKGKQTVMEGLCTTHTPVFSRMSGIQAWNNAIVLFVNVAGGPAFSYDNIFTKAQTADGHATVHVRWFAQARQKEETAVIVRMRRSVRGDSSLRLNQSYDDIPAGTVSTDPVLLFIRHGPYVYCGRLGYLGHANDSLPLEFRWQLLDFQALDWAAIERMV
ncbi:TPA: hypothetical protein N0F65_011324, partial [Lagenidium giganteum]